jgi:hypothetical protein
MPILLCSIIRCFVIIWEPSLKWYTGTDLGCMCAPWEYDTQIIIGYHHKMITRYIATRCKGLLFRQSRCLFKSADLWTQVPAIGAPSATTCFYSMRITMGIPGLAHRYCKKTVSGEGWYLGTVCPTLRGWYLDTLSPTCGDDTWIPCAHNTRLISGYSVSHNTMRNIWIYCPPQCGADTWIPCAHITRLISGTVRPQYKVDIWTLCVPQYEDDVWIQDVPQ